MIQLIMLNYAYDRRHRTVDELLTHYYTLTDWAESLTTAGAKVTVYQRFRYDCQVDRAGVGYHLLSDEYGPRLRGWQIPRRLHRRLVTEGRCTKQPTLLHINGLLFPLPTRHLRAKLPAAWPIVAQHHAEIPWPWPQRWLQRWALRAVDGFLFTHAALATPWLTGGVIPTPNQVYQILETSSPMSYQPRAAARAITGLHGRPIILWTGNLTANKDPLTILNGLEQILPTYPQTRLYMAYRQAELLPQVQHYLANRAALAQAVVLLGEIPHAEIAAYYNSADLFVQGSAREGSGIALLDALACGVVPVVTDIPAFRAITRDGKIGALWPVGQVAGLVQALRQTIDRLPEPSPRQIRHFFETYCHFQVVGQRALAIYKEVLRKRSHNHF